MMPQTTTTAATASLWQRLWYTRFRDVLRGRFDASLDWGRVLAAAELPEELTQIVHDTVRATRLWGSEKVDVTKELAAHFHDGLDSGATTQSLTAKFGDPRQTAALIRRAKKRGRPLAWQLWHFGWITLAVLFLAYLFTGLWMMTGRPSIKVDYLAVINEHAKNVPESERAWPLYRAALLDLGPQSIPDEYYPNSVIPHSEALPGDADWPQLLKLLHDHSDSVAQLRTAASRRDLGFVAANSFVAFTPEDRRLFGVEVTPEQVKAFESQTLEDRWLISTLIPNIRQLKSSAQILDRDARRAVLEGDAATAHADLLAVLGVSRHAEETPFFVNLLVAVAAQRMACDTVQDAFQQNPRLWSNAELRDLAHAIAAAQIDWKRGFVSESSGFQDLMQRFYTDDGHGDGRIAFRSSNYQNVFQVLSELTGTKAEDASAVYNSDALAMLTLPVANLVVASRKDTTEMYQTFINTAMSKIGLPLDEQQMIALPNEELLSDQAGPIARYRYMFLRIMVPAYQAIWNKIAYIDGRRDGVLLGIALELYHRDHATWPKSLGELSPRWLPAVPVDRITGKPLGYKIVDDRPVVYSFGVDRDDDGGTTPADDGKHDADLASPNFFQVDGALGATHNGDWVIWTTAPDN